MVTDIKEVDRKTDIPGYIQVNRQLALLNGREFRIPEINNMNEIKPLLIVELIPQRTRLKSVCYGQLYSWYK